MPNKMLIDAAHPEETRVVVLRGNRVEEFDFESASRKQLRGNIYLAKVTRVEPSLQAAFVDYGGNRHGFLAFSEIHPDYYQIPVADRQALIEEEERAARAADAEADSRAGRRAQRGRGADRPDETVRSEAVAEPPDIGAMAAASEMMAPPAGSEETMTPATPVDEESDARSAAALDDLAPALGAEPTAEIAHPEASAEPAPHGIGEPEVEATGQTGESAESPTSENEPAANGGNVTEVNGNGTGGEDDVIESVGGADAMEEVPERAPRVRRQYKIQEVIKRRQVMLVQVVKEERGTKGAALTTYLSLAGRYSVLMPNTARGGGISRKITDVQDRRRLKELAQELEVPEGMGVILRTAGASRTKTEIKRDFEYLLRLWETVRDLTLKSTAPMLVYEEGSLVKRSLRDLYNKDIDEILVAGEEGYREAREFMRMLMPSHAKNIRPFRDALPVFTRFGIESQLDAMFQPVVQLRSGGYVVLNQTEALVAIDVNSGRATREHHIEDTALKTNLEASEEIARQLRLRDLAGLIVIDFIDMEEKRNNRTVERRLKEALKNDRARIQVGHISHFGLLEMSRQRIRSSVLESSTEKCPHCGGSGHIRSVSSVALQLLRALEEMLLKGATHNLIVRTRTEIALYLLNHKRAHLRSLEERFQIAIMVNADASIGGPLSYVIEKGEQIHSIEQAKAIAAQAPPPPGLLEDEENEEYEDEEEPEPTTAEGAEAETGRAEGVARQARDDKAAADDGARRRRRRRRGRRGSEGREGREAGDDTAAVPHRLAPSDAPEEAVEDEPEAMNEIAAGGDGAGEVSIEEQARLESERRRRRRGRRGGRRNRRDREGEIFPSPSESDAAADAEPGVPRAEFGSHGAPTEQGGTQLATAVAEPVFESRENGAEPRENVAPVRERKERTGLRAPDPDREESSAPPPPSPPPAAAPEPPRRRSTVREPAPTSLGGDAGSSVSPHPEPQEPPQPTVSSPIESEPANRPRRSGWWNRRAVGKS